MCWQVARENRPVWVCGLVAPENRLLWACVGRLPKIIRSFSFLLFSLQAYYAKSLLRKHCKEGATVITQFWVTPKFCFPFLQKKWMKKKTARCHFERHGAASSPLQMQRQGRRRFLKIFPAILPLSLSTPLAQKSRMTHTHTCTTIPCNSHATMPCTWTGYGEPLPRLPINTGERTELRGVAKFWRRREG